jgi:hypothetical protein
LVTRGDQEEGLQRVVESLPSTWEVVVWDNGARQVSRSDGYAEVATDVSVYGRYAAIEHTTGDLIYVQDDDCIVSDPTVLLEQWVVPAWGRQDHVVCNMPEPWRSNPFYAQHALVGFGAMFHRDAPDRAFSRFALSSHRAGAVAWGTDGVDRSLFERTCDVVFTALTPRVLVSVPHESFDYAHGDDRMWKQPTHQQERQLMLELVSKVRDGR